MRHRDDRQLPLPLHPRLQVIQGEGKPKGDPLRSRDAVARVLIDAGADLLLRRISVPRAEAIEAEVNAVLALFDRVGSQPELMPQLEKRLAELEALVQETRERRQASRRR